MSRCQARCSVITGYRFSYGSLNQDRRFYQCKAEATESIKTSNGIDGQFCAYHAALPNVRVYKPANDYMPRLAA